MNVEKFKDSLAKMIIGIFVLAAVGVVAWWAIWWAIDDLGSFGVVIGILGAMFGFIWAADRLEKLDR